MSNRQPLLLTEATAQEIQLELMRRWQYNAFDGERVTASLLKHSALWQAVMMDRFCFSKPGKLPSIGLIKLRDLPDNIWNVDTLYVLTASAENAHRLAAIIEAEDWGGMALVHDDEEDVQSALGGGEPGQAVVSVWWD
jgi:hypothetical protein